MVGVRLIDSRAPRGAHCRLTQTWFLSFANVERFVGGTIVDVPDQRAVDMVSHVSTHPRPNYAAWFTAACAIADDVGCNPPRCMVFGRRLDDTLHRFDLAIIPRNTLMGREELRVRGLI